MESLKGIAAPGCPLGDTVHMVGGVMFKASLSKLNKQVPMIITEIILNQWNNSELKLPATLTHVPKIFVTFFCANPENKFSSN